VPDPVIRPRAALLAIAFATAAAAQDDPLSDDPLFAAEQPTAEVAGGAFYGDLALRGDRVTGFDARDDVERLRGRLRIGWRGIGDGWEYAVAAKLGAGTDSNADNRRNLDNEASDGIGLDEAYVRWVPDEDTVLTLRQDPPAAGVDAADLGRRSAAGRPRLQPPLAGRRLRRTAAVGRLFPRRPPVRRRLAAGRGAAGLAVSRRRAVLRRRAARLAAVQPARTCGRRRPDPHQPAQRQPC
jgi:hypothetical protein